MIILIGVLSALLGIGMTIFGLMAEIVHPLCWGYEMIILIGGLSALLGIGMTIFGLMAEPNDRLPTYPQWESSPFVVRNLLEIPLALGIPLALLGILLALLGKIRRIRQGNRSYILLSGMILMKETGFR